MVALATLIAASLPSGWTFGRNPERATAEASLPFAALIEGGHREITRATQLRAFELPVTIELAAMGATAAQEIAAAYAAIAAALTAAVEAGTGVGALAVRVEETGLGDPVRLDDEGHQFALAAPLELLVEFWTKENDLTALAP